MGRPLIALPAPIEVLATPFGDQDCSKLATAYTNAVYAAGGQPVMLPVVTDPPTGLLARMDGLLLTGGGDISPDLYGEEPDESVYGVRRDRDDFEVALYHEAVERGLPILAVCRGMQLINLLRGGTMIQNLETEQNHWQTVPSSHASHAIDIVGDTALADVLGPAEGHVNSFHHQGLGGLGDGLRVTATCGDVIEGVEADDIDLFAVQWHPEQMAATSAAQQAIFDRLVKRAATRPANDTR